MCGGKKTETILNSVDIGILKFQTEGGCLLVQLSLKKGLGVLFS